MRASFAFLDRLSKSQSISVRLLPVLLYLISTVALTLSIFLSDRKPAQVVPVFVLTAIFALIAAFTCVWAMSMYSKHCCYPTILVPYALASACFIVAMKTSQKAESKPFALVGFHLIFMLVVTIPMQVIAFIWMAVQFFLLLSQHWKEKMDEMKVKQVEDLESAGATTEYITDSEFDTDVYFERSEPIVEEVITDGADSIGEIQFQNFTKELQAAPPSRYESNVSPIPGDTNYEQVITKSEEEEEDMMKIGGRVPSQTMLDVQQATDNPAQVLEIEEEPLSRDPTKK